MRHFKQWAQVVIAAIVALAIVEAWLIGHEWPAIWQFFSDWQTLVAGALAFVGALLTVLYLSKQIQQTEHMEKERRKREENAIKAALPLSLSEISDYATLSIKLLNYFAPASGPNRVMAAAPTLPSFPADAVSVISECVRYADDKVVGDLSTLLSKLQIQHSRLKDLFERAMHTNQHLSRFRAVGGMIDAAEIHAKAASLFAYGRNTSDLRSRSSREEIDSAFIVAGIVTVDEQDLNEILQRRYQN